MEPEQNQILKKPENRLVLIELLIILVCSGVVFFLAGKYDFIETIMEFLKSHEDYEIDEIITVSLFLMIAFIFFSARRWYESKNMNLELLQKNKELQQAFSEIKKLRGIIPICSSCKNIRDDQGFWHKVEHYIHEHSDAEFSHGICPDCMKKLYPEVADEL